MWLNYSFRKKWAKQNKNILFIFSESPKWEEYIEEHIIPAIKEKSILLNWSKRAEWKTNKPLEVKVFHHWSGGEDFNPMAIVFAPKGKVKTIRFHQAFKELKKGKNMLLKEKESELYGYLN